ncbi:hypothetical protein [Streptomyces sp. NRRL B-24484]|uniref:hypothetical protein n=1 Tax=Streptomyces sp. NRRL B-24484 TaxID=1463833 RepID=UPI000AD4DA34|nr:hypothetical protein [Streptomyces sp. NRRL B-24484]
MPGETAVFSWRHGLVDIRGYFGDRSTEAAEVLAEALGARVLGDDDWASFRLLQGAPPA